MAKVVQTKQTKKIVVPTWGEQGRTGTNIFGGKIYEEYLSDLQGTAGLTVYDKMRRSDSQVFSTLELLKLPIVQAQWTVTASDDDPELGEEIAAFVEKVLFGGMDYTWEYVLAQALLMLDFGFCPLEKVWELREPMEGLEFPGLQGEMVWLKKLSPRMPNTITEWMLNEKTNELEKVKQTLPQGDEFEIDRNKLAIFVHHKEGDNWEGRSVLRSAYKNWYIKDTLEKIDAIGHERTSLGIPHFSIEEGYQFDPDSEEGKKLIDQLVDIATHLRANEQEFVITPPGVEFELASLGQDNKGLLDSIRYHDLHIMANILAQFMTLGQAASSGSRAVAEQQRGPFNLELEAITDNVGTTFEREVTRDIVLYNYGERPGYPQLTAKGVVESNQQPLALMVSQLVQYGVIIPDPALEDWLRKLLNLPTKAIVDLAAAGAEEEVSPDEETEPELDTTGIAQAPATKAKQPSIMKQRGPASDSSAYTETAEDRELFWRPPTPEEQYVAFEEIHYETEAAKRRFLTLVGTEARKLFDDVVKQAVEYARAKDPQALVGLKVDRSNVAALAKIIRDQVYVPLAQYGVKSVRDELDRVHRGYPIRRATATVSRLAARTEELLQYQNESEILIDFEDSRAQAAAETILSTGLAAAKSQGLKYIRTDDVDEEMMVALILGALDSQIRNMANDSVFESYIMGRAQETQVQVAQGNVSFGIYSALLDRNVCDACRMRDGQKFTVDQSEFYDFVNGNAAECYGGARCRCLLILY